MNSNILEYYKSADDTRRKTILYIENKDTTLMIVSLASVQPNYLLFALCIGLCIQYVCCIDLDNI